MRKLLSPLPNFAPPAGPVLLIVMDGIGIGPQTDANAVYKANTPVLDQLTSSTLYCELKAHGRAVGMPTDEDMGNSEVGHNALGAGRIFDQGASLVQHAIQSGALFKGKTWLNIISHVNQPSTTLHFIGLLSDGNVHSHIDHLLAMLDQASEDQVERVRIHILTDGRDVGEKSALTYIETLETRLSQLNQTKNRDYQIASGGGRMITTMDRYNADWSIVKRGWDAHVLGNARHFQDATTAVKTFYEEDPNRIDQYLPSFVIVDDQESPIGPIQDGDGVIFTHFRGDRAIEITQAFESGPDFSHFDRKRVPDILYAGMMQYDGDLKLPTRYLVDPPEIDNPISTYLCDLGIKSFAISETQKFGHVTYFWNGNRSGYVDPSLETYVEIPSDTIPFDQAPDMKAPEITQKTIDLLNSGNYQFGRLNFPNGDMVGHTGNFEATRQSIETTDRCVGDLIQTVNNLKGITVILADHGNADEMFSLKNGTKTPKTSHTLNPVPFAIVGPGIETQIKLADIKAPGLANVASTLCNLLGYTTPPDYEPSLIGPK